MRIFWFRPPLRSLAVGFAATPYGKHPAGVKIARWALAFTIACGLWLVAAGGRGEQLAERLLTVVALGDSLTAGYGLPADAAFPAQLERALRAKAYAVRVINAGVSGNTVADGLARLDWSVPDGADAVIVELGANDALRGLDPAVTRAGLAAILERLASKHLAILLAGMRAPRNLGPEYARDFEAIFPELASRFGATLYPFFLDGVAGDPQLNQPDGIHPNAAGVAVVVRRILPAAEEVIGRAKTAAGH